MTTAPDSVLTRLARVLLRVPLFAIPFALFFGTVLGPGPGAFLAAYKLALTFTAVIMLSQWTVQCFVVPRIRALTGWRPSILNEGLLYMVTSLVGAFLAAYAVQLYVRPGFLGTGRHVVAVAMYSLLFAGLITALVLVWQFHQGAIDQARTAKELELARRIQRSFLPQILPSSARVEVHAVNVPSRRVSGDLYDVIPVGGALLLAIADVEGKSIAAGLLMGMLQASLRTQTPWVASVSTIVANINAVVCRREGFQQFATFLLARVEDDGRRVTYCSAGHNPALLFSAAGDCTRLEIGGLMLGVKEDAAFEEEAVALERGDRLLCYTDGITETTNPRGNEYGPERLIALMQALPIDLSAEEISCRVLRAVDAFSERADAVDDRTLVILRVRG